MMEGSEDVPRVVPFYVLAGALVAYGEYLPSVSRQPTCLNVGGMVGHCALRQSAMGTRGIDEAPPNYRADQVDIDIAAREDGYRRPSRPVGAAL